MTASCKNHLEIFALLHAEDGGVNLAALFTVNRSSTTAVQIFKSTD